MVHKLGKAIPVKAHEVGIKPSALGADPNGKVEHLLRKFRDLSRPLSKTCL